MSDSMLYSGVTAILKMKENSSIHGASILVYVQVREITKNIYYVK